MWDAAVLGLGGVGSFALRALARRGVSAIGVERFTPGHDRGSSHGATRVTRHAYFEHQGYVPLLRRATQAFHELQAARGTPLIHPCGTLLIGRPGCEVVRASAEAAARHAIEVEALDTGALRARYPQFRVPDGWGGLLEPGGGFVRPEASIRAAVADAVERGASVRDGVEVVRIVQHEGHVALQTAEGEITTRRLIVAAGAWTSKLLPHLAPVLQVTRQVQGWIAPTDPALASADRLPTWFVVRAEGPPLYGIPIDPTGPPLAKVALHGLPVPFDPDTPRRDVTDEDRAALLEQTRAWLGLGDELVDAKSCLYTVTPDEHFVLDRAPGLAGVWVAAGLSGHGFKMVPALGEAMAQAALEGELPEDCRFLSLDRFGGFGGA